MRAVMGLSNAQLSSDEGECAVIDRAYRFLSNFIDRARVSPIQTINRAVISIATRCAAYDRPYRSVRPRVASDPGLEPGPVHRIPPVRGEIDRLIGIGANIVRAAMPAVDFVHVLAARIVEPEPAEGIVREEKRHTRLRI